jgi:YbbR domain-containing protein
MRMPALRLRRTVAPPETTPSEPPPPRPRPPWRPRIRMPKRRDLRELIRYNAGLKLVAIVLACFLWYSINALERDAERLVDVPVSIRRIPPDLIVTTPPTKPVTVTLRGPRNILDNIDEHKTRLVVDLSAATAGEQRIELTGGMLDPELPRRLKALRMQPPRLKVTVEHLAKRRLPVRVDLAGAPALGYMVSESSVTPDHVEVSGPASKVNDLKEITTEPIDLHGLATPFTRGLLLEWVGDYVTLVPDRVRVAVGFEEVMVSREFRRVPVVVRNGDHARVEPSAIDLTVKGPQRVLHNFKLPEDAVTVDAAGLEPGSHRVAPTIELPPTLEVVAREPDVLRVQIAR